MITGIGTPSNHNKIPRPIIRLLNPLIEERTLGRGGGSLPSTWFKRRASRQESTK